MIVYKDILQKLKEAGYNTTIIRRKGILSEGTLQRIRDGRPITTESIDIICRITKCNVEDLIEYQEEKGMRFILIDEVNGDFFTDYFKTSDEAVKEGERQWDRLTAVDKKKRNAFYVLESVNPDQEAPDHFDGNVIKEWK